MNYVVSTTTRQNALFCRTAPAGTGRDGLILLGSCRACRRQNKTNDGRCHFGHQSASTSSNDHGQSSGILVTGNPVSTEACFRACPQAPRKDGSRTVVRKLGDVSSRSSMADRCSTIVPLQLGVRFSGCQCHFMRCMRSTRRRFLSSLRWLRPMLPISSTRLSQSKAPICRVRNASA